MPDRIPPERGDPMTDEKDSRKETRPFSEDDLKRLTEILSTVRHGSVTLIIQDGKVVQIDRNEKIRLV
jgi:hypothetical protein